MSARRFLALSVLASASFFALAAVLAAQGRMARVDYPASVSMTLLPDLTPAARDPANRTVARAGILAQTVASRLKGELTAEMLGNFDLFVYVSKADHGPLAQRLYVFQRGASGEFELLHDWAASTGREQTEINSQGRRVFTATPQGYYQLDPRRMYRSYRSASWNQDMPNAMFFNWERAGLQTGLAIHAALGEDIAKLGNRASAGCVHLAPEHAAMLYDLVQAHYRGAVPQFAYDYESQTMSNQGSFMHSRHGKLRMADGYRVLVMIEDFGGDNAVAALF
jgi:hypothetical protein